MTDVGNSVEEGLTNVELTDLVSHLTEELRLIEGLEEGVAQLQPGGDTQVS